ncbi:MAG TPA: PilZ domain-containing protein [Gemmataceae bacterium]|nr:PilZ domain-containing protein [Gemmataceae bacterium]
MDDLGFVRNSRGTEKPEAFVSQSACPSRAFPAVERRTHSRFPCGQAAFCRANQPRDYIFWTAQARDVSATGIRLVVGHRFEPGTMLAIELLSPHQNMAREVAARVIYATELGGNGWVIGCEFAIRLSPSELAALM